jgi:hypothetical protein
MAATLTGYLTAAVLWLKGFLNLKAEINITPGVMHPMLTDILSQRRAWQRPKNKREPYTYEMFQILASQIREEGRKDATVSLDLKAAILDWVRLGTFTGSRVAEYAQTQGKKDCVSRIPDNPGAGSWSSDPIAFIKEDFTFYTRNKEQISIRDALRHPKKVYVVHIRFRYDKSPRNAVIRKFVVSAHPWLCPVKAALSIVARAEALKIGHHFPLGIYRSNAKGRPVALLRSYQVIKTMRQAVVDAYPNPSHHLRQHILQIDSHSNRVTAAVALSNAGLSIDEIAFRLRWKPASVDHYLRDCPTAVGRLTEAAIRGSLLI